MVYFVVGLVEAVDAIDECRTVSEVFWNATGILFICFQIAILMKLSGVNSPSHSVIGY